MVETSLWVNKKDLVAIQKLVKKHNLRFKGQGEFLSINDRVSICISSDHLPPGGCNAFWDDYYEMFEKEEPSIVRETIFSKCLKFLLTPFKKKV